MCVVYDDRIDIGNINTAFHNVGTNKYVIFPVDKIKDTFFKVVTFHLSVSMTDAKVRAKSPNDIHHFRKIADPVVYEKDLPAALCFKIDCITNYILIINLYFCFDRLTVGRRRIDNAQVSCAHQRKLESSWNWRRGQCQTIHSGTKGFYFFLVTHAELLLLIHYQ